MTIPSSYRLREFIEMHWLRPETALWNCVSSKLCEEDLKGRANILELGIGNGYFTLMSLGGKFKSEFDWFYSVDTQGFNKGADIYDYDANLEISHFIDKAPQQKIDYALDVKPNLLSQAMRLNFINESVTADGNDGFSERKVDTFFSNMVYWLDDKDKVFIEIDKLLNPGGVAVIVAPNHRYEEYCRSYDKSNKLWYMLNRGRDKMKHWHIEIDDFEEYLSKNTSLKVERYQHYLSDLLLKSWDIGLRMISPQLIKMSNKISAKQRLDIKMEWCDNVEPLLKQVMAYEIKEGPKNGGYTHFVLKKE